MRRAATVEIDRLLAEDRLAGAGRRLDQIGMGVGRAGDQDRIDGRVGQRFRLIAQNRHRTCPASRSAAAWSVSTIVCSRASGWAAMLAAWIAPMRPAPNWQKLIMPVLSIILRLAAE